MDFKKRLVMFDLDGTLVDAYDAVYLSLNHSFSLHGYPMISHQEIKRSVGWGETSLVRKFVADSDLSQVLKDYREHHRQSLLGRVNFLTGVEDLLADLKAKHLKLAIVTNRPKPFTDIILRDMKMESYMDGVICGDEVDNPKPSGDMLRIMLKRLNCSVEESLYVGDMTVDAHAGLDAGVATVLVTTGSCNRKELLSLQVKAVVDQIAMIRNFIF